MTVSANAMRRPKNICLLCQERNSTQKNSHLIPKYFGKGIFEGTKPRHGISINKKGQRNKVQDIVKEDFLFCPECEKGISIFETYCLIRLERYNNLRYFNNYKRVKQGEFEYFECKDLDIRIFNLFTYSIIWRVSISKSYDFGGFKLPASNEEELRLILNRFICLNQSELLEKVETFETLPNHSHVIIRPKKKLRPPNSMLSAASLNDWLHELHLIDYIVFYLTNNEKLVDGFKSINNNNLIGPVRVGLTSEDNWKSFNSQRIKDSIE
jgi:hypothetical protein